MSKKLVQSDEFSPIFNRLIAICDSKKYSVSNLLDKFATSRSAINAWKKGNISAGTTAEIAKALGVSLEYLIMGQEKSSSVVGLTADEQELLKYFKKLSDKSKGKVIERAEMLAELEAPATSESEEEPEEQETIFIEFATLKASAGTGEQLIDDPEQDFIEVVKNDTTLQAKFAIQIHGDSMEPEYSDGDIVLVKTQPQINVGQIGIFTVNDMGYIKKLGTDRLVSINPEYDDIYFKEGQDIRCKGLVIGTLEDDEFV